MTRKKKKDIEFRQAKVLAKAYKALNPAVGGEEPKTLAKWELQLKNAR